MLSLDDEKWSTLDGGHRTAYDASIALKKLERGEAPTPIWEELWEELHHQGDVGLASYASVPHLVRIATTRGLRDWNVFGLLLTIDFARHEPQNPPVPEWLALSYDRAWQQLLEFALFALRSEVDEVTARSALAVVVVAKGLRHLGRLLSDFDASEIEAIYDESYGRNA